MAHPWQRQGNQHGLNSNQHAKCGNQHALNCNQHAKCGNQHALNRNQHAKCDNQHPTNQHAQPCQRNQHVKCGNQPATIDNQHPAYNHQRRGSQHALNKDKHASSDNQHPSNNYQHAHSWQRKGTQHALTDNQHIMNNNQHEMNNNQHEMKNNQHVRKHRNASTNRFSDDGHGEGPEYEDRLQEETQLERVRDCPTTTSSSSSTVISSVDHQLQLPCQSESEPHLDQPSSKTNPSLGLLQYLQEKWKVFKQDFHQRFWAFNRQAKAKCRNSGSVVSSGLSAIRTSPRKPRFACFWSSIKSSKNNNKKRQQQ